MNCIINEKNFHELMISNDEDLVFDKFMEYLYKILKDFPNNFNILDVKRLFSINLKIFDLFLFKENWENDFSNEELEELNIVYNKTCFIVNNIDSEDSYIKNELFQAINIVNNYWKKKMTQQKNLSETFKKSINNLNESEKRFNDILLLNKISSFCKDNINNKSNSEKVNYYIEKIESMLKQYPEKLITKVNNNINRNRKYYENSEGQTKEYIDEMNLANMLTLSLILSNMNKV